jgi:hypothetical protein
MEQLRGFAGADWHRVKQLTRAPRQGLGFVPITPTLPIIPTLRMWRSNYTGVLRCCSRITQINNGRRVGSSTAVSGGLITRACCVPPSESRQIITAAELVARRPSVKSEFLIPSPTPLVAASTTTAKGGPRCNA